LIDADRARVGNYWK